MSEVINKLTSKLFTTLKTQAPKLSGNTRNSIQIKNVGEHEVTLVINPRFYDLNAFKNGNGIVYNNAVYFRNKGTHKMDKFTLGEMYWAKKRVKRPDIQKILGLEKEVALQVYEYRKRSVMRGSIRGVTSYAMWVNNYGAFCTGNSSKHWCNRACFEACNIMASELKNCEVINELEL